MKFFTPLISAFCTLLLSSCISNDIPYPVVPINILSMQADGLSADGVKIDTKERIATLDLEETTDIQNVNITAVELTEGGSSSENLIGKFDLRTPIYTTLSLYQNYSWVIKATQTIERDFQIKNQIGAAKLDLTNHIATAYIAEDADLTQIQVTKLKLGPKDITTYSPTAAEITDFTSIRSVEVTYHGRTEHWTLSVEPTAIEIAFNRVDAWTNVAHFYASGRSGTQMGFRYRKQGSTEWIEVPSNYITIDGGSLSATMHGLSPETAYEVVAYSGSSETAIQNFTTEGTFSLPNNSFEDWVKEDKSWYPYSERASSYWGTGNPGATTLGEKYNITTQYVYTDHNETPPTSQSGKSAALLETTWVVLKLAAGNIFTGSFAGVSGTNGKVNFGHPFTLHPLSLSGYYRYTCGAIDKVGKQPSGKTIAVGDPDQGSIYIALGNWDAATYGGTDESPVQINTAEVNTFFNSEGPNVMAYGELIMTETVNEWKHFTIQLKYRSTDVKPTHLIIVCAASRWGDYFTGSTKSKLYLDDFVLNFDDVK